MKLYEDGLVLKLKPDGEKFTVVIPFLTTCVETLQLVVKGSLSLERPAPTWNVWTFGPQESVTEPGDCISTTAHRKSSVCE